MKTILRRGRGTCRGPVVGAGTVRASLKGGPVTGGQGENGGKVQSEAGKAVGTRPRRAL